MSHATVLVALTPEQLATHGGDVEAAVTFQMAPFDENGGWFRDGSRWDWWVIGGRYAGRLLGRDVCLRADLNEERLRQQQLQRADDLWREWEAESRHDDVLRELIYGLRPDDTRESVRERFEQELLSAHAFLRDRRWHEQERLGWFGTPTITECARQADARGESYQGVCTYTDKETAAAIVSFGEGDGWKRMFFRRFVENLAADTTLVMVDYHV
jgi:hypothetical protein